MTTGRRPRADRRVVQGLVFLLLLVALVVGTVALYRGAFDDTVEVRVRSDRAGLTLAEGAPVKLRGVVVGSVGRLATDGERVTITLELDRDVVDRVPADVSAQIVPPTAFGAKYVQLTPTGEGGPAIEAGAVIAADKVTVEVDEAFESLARVLDVARPTEVNAALTAAAGALDARGRVIGELISQTDRYLRSLNPSLRSLSDDLAVADDVTDVYEAARPDLVATLSRTGTLSRVVVRQRASLQALERGLTGFSDEADSLLRSSESGLVTSLRLLEPVTAVLERYSPELPCLVLGLVRTNKLAEAAVGGTHPGLTTITRLIPGRGAYTYRDNLPVVGDDRGPTCYGLPDIDPAEARQPAPSFRSGANPQPQPLTTPGPNLLEALLGVDGGEQ